jgi:hypothetical protein
VEGEEKEEEEMFYNLAQISTNSNTWSIRKRIIYGDCAFPLNLTPPLTFLHPL